MRRNNSMLKKSHMSLLLILLLVAGIGIGYAALATTLQINGTTTINAVTWDVHFENAVETKGADLGTVTIGNDSNQPGTSNTTATYSVTLEKPGDVYEFTIDVVNKGTLDAKLQSSSVQDLEGTAAVLANLETDGIPADGTILTKKVSNEEFGHYTITVTITYDPDVNPEQLQSEAVSTTRTITLNYVQNR